MLDLFALVIRVADEEDRLDYCRLEVELLPEGSERAIDGAFPERLGPAVELFGAAGRDPYRCTTSPGRLAAS